MYISAASVLKCVLKRSEMPKLESTKLSFGIERFGRCNSKIEEKNIRMMKFHQQARICNAMFTLQQKCREEAVKVQHKLLLATSEQKIKLTKKG